MIALSLLLGFLGASTAAPKCQRVVCYYTNWAQYRNAPFKFVPENIDATLCTHINYAFAKLNGNQLAAFEWNDETEPWAKGMYEKCADCAHKGGAKILLSVGGWNMGSQPFTDMVATEANRLEFAQTSTTFLRNRNFDGLDLDWEYPANRGSPPEDRDRFVELLKVIDSEFTAEAIRNGRPKLLLTAAVSAGKATTLTGYNVTQVEKYVDFLNIMTYDLHGSWETFAGHNSPLFARSSEVGEQRYLNVEWAAKHWVSLGLPKHKLVLGLPTYGRTFTLQSAAASNLGDTTKGAGKAGTYTRAAGFLAYYEICKMIASGTVHWEAEQRVPYLVQGDQWVGYDDDLSLREKVNHMNTSGYGGVMIWAMDLDDFPGSCGQGPYPLLKAINMECERIPESSNTSPTTHTFPSTKTSYPGLPSHTFQHSLLPHPPLNPNPPVRHSGSSFMQPVGRHGTQIQMFRLPTHGVNHHHRPIPEAPANDQQLVQSLTKSTSLVLNDRQSNRQPSWFDGNFQTSHLPRPANPDSQSFRQTISSFKTAPAPRHTNPTFKSSRKAISSLNLNPPQSRMAVSQIPQTGDSSFAVAQRSRISLLPENFMKKILRGNRVGGGGGVKINFFNDDSTDVFNCIAKPDGLYPSPTSCQHFFICKGQAAHRKSCENGLVYNPGQKYCDWPYNYKCNIAVADNPSSSPSTGQTGTPPNSPPAGQEVSPCQRVVCYYTNWAQYRPQPYNFLPENINPSLCTHINYAFANLTGNHLAPYEWNDEEMFMRIVTHTKYLNPAIKVLLSVGGWTMSSPPFSDMVATPEGIREFAVTSAVFLRDRNLDGLDIDWEYPGSRESPAEDRDNFVELLMEINTVFEQEAAESGRPRLLLTAAVGAGKATIDAGYDIPQISNYLDFINLMTYDLHGAWDPVTGHNSPLYAHTGETEGNEFLNVDWAAKYWVSQGAPKEKLVIGVPTYGRSFTLAASESGLGALTSGPGNEGLYTRAKGILSYYEICQMKLNGGTVYNIDDQQVPYLVKGDQWVGFDDAISLRKKVKYMKDNGFGGVMVWTAALDDFMGFCGEGINPLLTAIDTECRLTSSSAKQAITTSSATSKAPTSTMAPGVPGNPLSPDDFCSTHGDGLYGDVTDCSYYYQCADPLAFRQQCPATLGFNPATGNCDWLSSIEDGACIKH